VDDGDATDVVRVAELLRVRNGVEVRMSEIIGRPMVAGHLGEWLAEKIFDVQLEKSASAKAIDGRFRSGPRVGQTVNVKWHRAQHGLLDLIDSAEPAFYLVFAAPPSAAGSSRNKAWPVVIASVHLFDSAVAGRTTLTRREDRHCVQRDEEAVERGRDLPAANEHRTAAD
jgi:hypothetical protein